jgi:hypothetical protein
MSSSSDSDSAAAGGGATAKSENELSDTVADDKGNGEVSEPLSEFDVLKDVGEWLESRERGSSGEESGVHAEPIIEAENDVPFESENKEEGDKTDKESI